MKTSLFLLFMAPVVLGAQAPTPDWQQRIPAYSGNGSADICQVPDGGYLQVSLNSMYYIPRYHNFGYDATDILVTRLSSNGDVLWQNCYGGNASEWNPTILRNSDGNYLITCATMSDDGDISATYGETDVWFCEIDAAGNIVREKSIGGSGHDLPSWLSATPDGGYILIGSTTSTTGDLMPGAKSDDYWIAKLDASLNISWQKCYGGPDGELATEIHPTSDGGYIACGFGNSNGGDVTGNHGSCDYWVIKLNSAGDLTWQKSLGGTREEYCYSICETADGGFVAAGRSNSNDGNVSGKHGGTGQGTDYWLVKLSDTGDIIWQKCYGGTYEDFATRIIRLSNNNLIVCGESESDDGDITQKPGDYTDGWLLEINPANGNIVWERMYRFSVGYDRPTHLSETPDHGIVFSGITSMEPPSYQTGLWVVKLAGDPTGLEINNPDLFSVGPNPVIDKLTISSGTNKIDAITVYNALGEEVQISPAFENENTCSLVFDNLPLGLYFVEVKSEGLTCTKKIIRSN